MAFVLSVFVIGRWLLRRNNKNKNNNNNKEEEKSVLSSEQTVLFLRLLWSLCVWPAAFLAGLTLLGSLGAGFQLRFLAPMLPGSAVVLGVISAYAPLFFRDNDDDDEDEDDGALWFRAMRDMAVVLAVPAAILSAVTGFYYGVLYAPLYADLPVSVFDVLVAILSNPLPSLSGREMRDELSLFMRHFGLRL